MKNTLRSNLAGSALIVALVSVASIVSSANVPVDKCAVGVQVASAGNAVNDVIEVNVVGAEVAVVRDMDAVESAGVVQALGVAESVANMDTDVPVEAQDVPVTAVSKVVDVVRDTVLGGVINVSGSVDVDDEVAAGDVMV